MILKDMLSFYIIAPLAVCLPSMLWCYMSTRLGIFTSTFCSSFILADDCSMPLTEKEAADSKLSSYSMC